MAASYWAGTGNGTTTDFPVPFAYLDALNVFAKVAGVTASFVWLTSTTIRITPAPASGARVFVYRQSPTTLLVDFTTEGLLTENDLDTAYRHSLYLAEEAVDTAQLAMSTDPNDGKFDGQSKVIKNVADPVNAQDAATKVYVDATLPASTAAASASASAAAASATAAAASATAAGTSATNAATSATAAATSAASVSLPNISSSTGVGEHLRVKLDKTGYEFRTPTQVIADLGLGTAAIKNTGTSGANVPLLNTLCTWSAGLVITGAGLVLGAATGGDKGAGTLNATAVYVNGAAFSVDAPRLIVQDRKASGTAGSSITVSTYTDHDCQTVLLNTITGASLSNPNITLPAGTYDVTATATWVQGASGAFTRVRLFNTTTGSVLTDTSGADIVNVNSNGGASAVSVALGPVRARFTLAGSTQIKFQQFANSGGSTQGLALNAVGNAEPEVYLTAEFIKVS